MVCKKYQVYDWFRTLDGAKRIDFLNGMLHLCYPLELRFLGSCIEELARKDYAYLKDAEHKANTPAEIQQMRDIGIADKVTRSKMIVTLALLASNNYECAKLLFELLNVDINELLDTMMQQQPKLIDCKIADEFLLLLTMAANHPAFNFQMKSKMSQLCICAERKLKTNEIISKENESDLWSYNSTEKNGTTAAVAANSSAHEDSPRTGDVHNDSSKLDAGEHSLSMSSEHDKKVVFSCGNEENDDSSQSVNTSRSQPKQRADDLDEVVDTNNNNNSDCAIENAKEEAKSSKAGEAAESAPPPSNIESINFEGVQTIKGTDNYKFIIKVKWTDGTSNEIDKTYSELCEFNRHLTSQHPGEMASLAESSQLVFKENQKEDFIKELPLVTNYCSKIVSLPKSVSESLFVRNFFHHSKTLLTPKKSSPKVPAVSRTSEKPPLPRPLHSSSQSDYQANHHLLSINPPVLKLQQTNKLVESSASDSIAKMKKEADSTFAKEAEAEYFKSFPSLVPHSNSPKPASYSSDNSARSSETKENNKSTPGTPSESPSHGSQDANYSNKTRGIHPKAKQVTAVVSVASVMNADKDKKKPGLKPTVNAAPNSTNKQSSDPASINQSNKSASQPAMQSSQMNSNNAGFVPNLHQYGQAPAASSPSSIPNPAMLQQYLSNMVTSTGMPPNSLLMNNGQSVDPAQAAAIALSLGIFPQSSNGAGSQPQTYPPLAPFYQPISIQPSQPIYTQQQPQHNYSHPNHPHNAHHMPPFQQMPYGPYQQPPFQAGPAKMASPQARASPSAALQNAQSTSSLNNSRSNSPSVTAPSSQSQHSSSTALSSLPYRQHSSSRSNSATNKSHPNQHHQHGSSMNKTATTNNAANNNNIPTGQQGIQHPAATAAYSLNNQDEVSQLLLRYALDPHPYNLTKSAPSPGQAASSTTTTPANASQVVSPSQQPAATTASTNEETVASSNRGSIKSQTGGASQTFNPSGQTQPVPIHAAASFSNSNLHYPPYMPQQGSVPVPWQFIGLLPTPVGLPPIHVGTASNNSGNGSANQTRKSRISKSPSGSLHSSSSGSSLNNNPNSNKFSQPGQTAQQNANYLPAMPQFNQTLSGSPSSLPNPAMLQQYLSNFVTSSSGMQQPNAMMISNNQSVNPPTTAPASMMPLNVYQPSPGAGSQPQTYPPLAPFYQPISIQPSQPIYTQQQPQHNYSHPNHPHNAHHMPPFQQMPYGPYQQPPFQAGPAKMASPQARASPSAALQNAQSTSSLNNSRSNSPSVTAPSSQSQHSSSTALSSLPYRQHSSSRSNSATNKSHPNQHHQHGSSMNKTATTNNAANNNNIPTGQQGSQHPAATAAYPLNNQDELLLRLALDPHPYNLTKPSAPSPVSAASASSSSTTAATTNSQQVAALSPAKLVSPNAALASSGPSSTSSLNNNTTVATCT